MYIISPQIIHSCGRDFANEIPWCRPWGELSPEHEESAQRFETHILFTCICCYNKGIIAIV